MKGFILIVIYAVISWIILNQSHPVSNEHMGWYAVFSTLYVAGLALFIEMKSGDDGKE